MGEVNITIDGRSFKIGCTDGQEDDLRQYAHHLGNHVETLKKALGAVSDEQLYLMAGLMVCDELARARADLAPKQPPKQPSKTEKTASAPMTGEPEKPSAKQAS